MAARFSLRCVIATLCLTAALGADSAQAQFVRGRVGGGIVVRAPFVPRIVIGPRPFVRPVVPLVRPVAPLVRPVAPLIVPRRVVGGAVVVRAPLAGALAPVRVAAPSYSGAQVFASQGAPAAASAAATDESSFQSAPAEQPFPTDADLQSLDDGNLLNALIDVTSRLDADLARFTTGAQWRAYLQLPADAVPPPTDNRVVIGMASLKATLARYDKIASDSAYRSINDLPSFAASRAALAESVTRFGSRQAPPQTPPQIPPQLPPQTPPQAQSSSQPSGVVPASAQEELPSPALSAPAANPSPGERSILSR